MSGPEVWGNFFSHLTSQEITIISINLLTAVFFTAYWRWRKRR